MRTNGGLHKIMRLDEKLSALIGVEEDSRAQVKSREHYIVHE
jgi:hypothetical protein